VEAGIDKGAPCIKELPEEKEERPPDAVFLFKVQLLIMYIAFAGDDCFGCT